MAGIVGVTTDQRLQALARSDKWYLSCGDGVLWAPPFPTWLHVPGFWDEAHVYYHPVAPLFAVALVDASGRAIPLERRSWRWRPDRIDVQWALPSRGHAHRAPVCAAGRAIHLVVAGARRCGAIVCRARLARGVHDAARRDDARRVRRRRGRDDVGAPCHRSPGRRGRCHVHAHGADVARRCGSAPLRCEVRRQRRAADLAAHAVRRTLERRRVARRGAHRGHLGVGMDSRGARGAGRRRGDVRDRPRRAVGRWGSTGAGTRARLPVSGRQHARGRRLLRSVSAFLVQRSVSHALLRLSALRAAPESPRGRRRSRALSVHRRRHRLLPRADHLQRAMSPVGDALVARSGGGVWVAAELPRHAARRRRLPRADLQHAPAADRLLSRELGRRGAGSARRARRRRVRP